MHKEHKSGVEIRGDMITIRSGVGAPSVINVLSFSQDGTLLAAGKDFGRVVVWNVHQQSFVVAIDTGQGIVNAVAISPDDQLIATSGQDKSRIKLWRLSDRKLLKSFKLKNSWAQKLIFGPDPCCIVVRENSGTTYVLNVQTGKDVADMPGEWDPVLSTDGKTLMTVSKDKVVLRNTANWQKDRELAKPAKYAYPLSIDTQLDTYVYGDATEAESFVAARISTGEPLPGPHAFKLPRLNLAAGGFAAIDPQSGLVFGHSGGRLWAWNIVTGKTCVSPLLYSESGALSPNGSFVAAGIDNSIFAKVKTKPGVELWKTKSIQRNCDM